MICGNFLSCLENTQLLEQQATKGKSKKKRKNKKEKANLNIKRKTLDQDLPHDRLDDLSLEQLQAGLGVPYVQAEKN